jgi:hypothetical protein
MVTVRALLARGNSKLGSAIHHFDLPAVRTCPGRSSVCEAVCYATRNRFRTDPVRERLHWPAVDVPARGDLVRPFGARMPAAAR